MRKIIFLFSLICISLVLSGCSCSKATISYSTDTISVYQNEIYTIDTKDIIITNGSGYTISVLDENIATISGNDLTPKSIGSTIIRIAISDKQDIYFDINYEVKFGNLPQNISVQNSVVNIYFGVNNTAINKLTVDKDCVETPTVTYDENIINYDWQTGAIVAKKIGVATVTISYSTKEISFTVNVKSKVFAHFMTVKDCILFTNSEGKFDFEVFPTNANAYNFWTEPTNLLTVYADGTYKTHKTMGSIVIKFQYELSENYKSEICTFTATIMDKLEPAEITIRTPENNIPSALFLHADYELVINLPKRLEMSNFTFSENIDNSFMRYEDNTGYVIPIQFKQAGVQNISVTITETLAGNTQSIVCVKPIQVYNETDVKVGAKWSAYDISNTDNTYILSLSSAIATPNNLLFILKLNSMVLNDKFIVYAVDGESKTVTDKYFVPSETGTYVFEFELYGVNIGIVNVIVQE